MTRGDAQRAFDTTPRVMVWPDGGISLTNQPYIEAIAAIAEADSHAHIDQLRRELDTAIAEHYMRFGYGTYGQVSA